MHCIRNHFVKGRFNTAGQRSGFSLIEVMVAIVIIMVLATGAMGYQFLSTRDVKLSEVQTTATRMSLLLLESWKGDQGAPTFDPVAEFGTELAIQTSATGPAVPAGGMTQLGNYRIDSKGVSYYITLSYADSTASEPQLLSAVICWRKDFSQGTLDGSEQSIQNSTYVNTY